MQVPDRLDPLTQQNQELIKLQPDRQAAKVVTDQGERLKQLIAKLKQLMGSVPAELSQLISSLIIQAEQALASGDSISIGQLVNKLEEALDLIMAIIRELSKGNTEAAQELIAAFVSKMTGLRKIRDKLIQQQEASLEDSLQAMIRQKFQA
jgi:Na+-transporting NADH:ubiquinone oxidoreductase subunit NqrA